jgi:Asp/Glu/hydantoin racemase
VNPNSSQVVTDGIKSSLQEQEISIEFMTGPASSPPTINNEDDAQQSAKACLPVILERMNQPDPPSAILVACYSDHPLVPQLRREVARPSGFHVLGIFEASINAALKSIKPGEKFGVITTGKDWEPILTEGVLQYLNETAEDAEPDSFAGVIGTGLGVLDLHGGDAGNVQTSMAQAAKELASKGGTRAICLGCAGMSGLERIIEDVINEEGSKKKVVVIDGVRHGIKQLVALITDIQAPSVTI